MDAALAVWRNYLLLYLERFNREGSLNV
jgi:hypothetical protein